MILCIGTTPAAQRVMIFPRLNINEVNRATTTLSGAAGKSVNVAKVLHALGARPLATGFLGMGHGKAVRDGLSALGVEMDFVNVMVPGRQCTTVIDQASHTVTELVEESLPVPPDSYDQLLTKIRARLAECRAVVMSGSLTPGGPVDFYRRCIEATQPSAALTVVDAQGPPLVESLQAKPGLIKPNRAELCATLGRKLQTETEVCTAMRGLFERGAQRIVTTAGKDPVMAFDGSTFWRVTTPRIEALNPIGSGDAFTAALTWRLLRGDDLGEACRWAAAAGAANALTPMAGELDPGQMEQLLVGATSQRI